MTAALCVGFCCVIRRVLHRYAFLASQQPKLHAASVARYGARSALTELAACKRAQADEVREIKSREFERKGEESSRLEAAKEEVRRRNREARNASRIFYEQRVARGTAGEARGSEARSSALRAGGEGSAAGPRRSKSFNVYAMPGKNGRLGGSSYQGSASSPAVRASSARDATSGAVLIG